ncbi:hypothetical protein [Dactylosporangium sp. NPDC050588]|uniref:hypothetical protein n=1 Tax=Dactylosporangium sp. NPDC050588 TaxID=3157211 RepID=UPI0033D51897
MPLHLPDPPSGAHDHVKSRLHTLAAHGGLHTKALRGARADQLDLSTPHQVFTLGADDIAAGGGLDRAEPAGWRYLVESAGQVVASAETMPAPDGTQRFANVNEGPFVDATDKAMKVVRKLPKLEAAGFELRLLRVPSLYLTALWLHSPAEDLLVPLQPSPIGKEGKSMSAAEFLSDLAEYARSRPSLPPPPPV